MAPQGAVLSGRSAGSQRFRLNVGARPRDSRLVLLASALALAAAVALFLYLLLR